MTILQAIILGAVQGVTEWLPISSTAHLRVVPALAGWPDPGSAFTAVTQFGTILAVLIYFRGDLARILSAFFSSFFGGRKDLPEVRLAWGVFWGTLPIIVVGVLFRHEITTVFRSLEIIAWALIIFGCVMWAADRWLPGNREIGEVGVREGLIVGLFQTLSLIPGMSRSGSTMTGAYLCRLNRPTAARYSFLLSIPSITGAGFYELYNERHAIFGAQLVPVLVATAVAFVVGYATIAWLIRYLQRRGLGVFVGYRLVLGALLLFLIHSGHLQPDAGAKPIEKPTASATMSGGVLEESA